MPDIKIKPRVYISEELKRSSLKDHIVSLGYIPKEEINILKDAKFACLCSEGNVSYQVDVAVRSGIPVILVSKGECIDKRLETDCLDFAFPTHRGKHACFDEEQSKPVITWIDHCFEKIAKKRCDKMRDKLDRLCLGCLRERRMNNE